ncbi:unnamed protein product [Symbiodinium sp. KB8]|nr:unnamed protein product [Symbiodinium sp. KB8]
MYDRKMRQETEYQIMDFRIKQAELWREDVRDIIGLTSVKMDTYLIVNAVQLGFTVMAFCEGRLASGTPTWLVGCHTLSLAGAFMYLLMSVWFSMHASVTAKSYETRLLTQLVRLPVPSWAQLEAARTYGSTFEKTKTTQMFRVPFAMGSQQRVLGEASSSTAPALTNQEGAAEGTDTGPPAASADLWGLEGNGEEIYELDGKLRTDPASQRHLQLIKQVMHYWQSYDGFARVAMSMGTNQLILGLSYYVIGYVLISNKAIIACWLVVLLFMVIATALIRLDMSLTGFEFRAAMAACLNNLQGTKREISFCGTWVLFCPVLMWLKTTERERLVWPLDGYSRDCMFGSHPMYQRAAYPACGFINNPTNSLTQAVLCV